MCCSLFSIFGVKFFCRKSSFLVCCRSILGSLSLYFLGEGFYFYLLLFFLKKLFSY